MGGRQRPLQAVAQAAARRITRDACSLWNESFITEGAELSLKSPDLFTDWLSPADENALDELDARFHDATAEEMVEWTHANCAEWSNPAPAEKKPITLAEILKAVGYSKEDAKWAIAEAVSYDWEDTLMAYSGYKYGKRANQSLELRRMGQGKESVNRLISDSATQRFRRACRAIGRKTKTQAAF